MPIEIYHKAGYGRRVRFISQAQTVGLHHLYANLYSSLGLPPASAPTVVSAPVIAGTAAEGSSVTATAGVFDGNPAPTITRQWYLGPDAQPGQTGPTFTVPSGSAGKAVTLKETATNASGSVVGTSNAITVPAP